MIGKHFARLTSTHRGMPSMCSYMDYGNGDPCNVPPLRPEFNVNR